METQAPRPCTDSGAASAADETQEPKNDNAALDAWRRSLDTIDPAILDHAIEIASGLHCKDPNFKTSSGTVLQLLERLMLVRDAAGTQRVGWARGAKDGACILQGGLIAGGRSAKNVRANHIVMVDYDTGYSIEEIAAAIRKRGLFALLWTTHSHLKSETLIAEAVLVKWATGSEIDVALAGAYLAEVKRYKAQIAASISSLERVDVDGRTKFKVVHAPMPRVRALFVLTEPFEFAKHGTQTERIDEWKERYAGFCQQLNLPWDRSCCDPSRLMYTPRIANDADERQHAYMILPGRTLSLADMPRVAGEKRRKNATSGHGGRHEFQTTGLLPFLARYSGDFEAADWMMSVDPDGLRRDQGNKLDFCCPNEESHTEIKADDTAFMVTNASGGDSGFYMGCLHDGCIQASGQDRGWYLDQACMKYGVSDASELEEWCPAAQAEAARHAADEKARSEERNAILAIMATPGWTAEMPDAQTRRPFMRRVARAWPDKTDRQIRAREIARAYGSGELRHSMMKEIEAAHSEDVAQERRSRKSGDRPVVNVAQGYEDIVRNCAKNLEDAQKDDADPAKFARTPTLFKNSRGVVRMTDGRIEELRLQRAPWRAAIEDGMDFENLANKSVCADKELIERISGSQHKLTLPELRRIVHLPVFAPDGALQTESGYVSELNVYLSLKEQFRALPEVLSKADVDEALALLGEVLRDIPFSDSFGEPDTEPQYSSEIDADGWPRPNDARGQSSRTNLIALLLQPIVRGMIAGPCPAYHLDKPAPGTGASLITQVLSTIISGEVAPTRSAITDVDELRKQLTTALRGGRDTLIWDNINAHLDSGDLASALTAGEWNDRQLGTNVDISVRITQTFIFAGNGLSMSEELRDRMVPIYIDANVEKPDSDRPTIKDGARYKYPNLIADFVLPNRTNLVWSLHVIVAYYVQERNAGRYVPVRTIGGMAGRFAAWNDFFSNVFAASGIPGFLANRQSYMTMRSDAKDGLAEFVSMWWDKGLMNSTDLQTQPNTSTEIFDLCASPLRSDVLAVSLAVNGKDKEGRIVSLGRIIASVVGRVFTVKGPKIKIVKARDRNPTKYILVDVSA